MNVNVLIILPGNEWMSFTLQFSGNIIDSCSRHNCSNIKLNSWYWGRWDVTGNAVSHVVWREKETCPYYKCDLYYIFKQSRLIIYPNIGPPCLFKFANLSWLPNKRVSFPRTYFTDWLPCPNPDDNWAFFSISIHCQICGRSSQLDHIYTRFRYSMFLFSFFFFYTSYTSRNSVQVLFKDKLSPNFPR